MDTNLVVHGPLSPFTERLLFKAVKAKEDGIVQRIILSTYREDLSQEKYVKISGYCDQHQIVIVESDDVLNPGFANINRQINLFNAGLSQSEEGMAIKLRTDQLIDFKCLSRVLNRYGKELCEGKLLTTNCFTRVDRLYHPSDMFMVAKKTIFEVYFPKHGFDSTDLDDRLAVSADLKNGMDVNRIEIWPETRLFKSFLRNRGWSIKDTKEDSIAALRKYFLIIDARVISLKWEKFFDGRIPLVPYRFLMAPFPGGPIEDARCFDASVFGTCTPFYSKLTKIFTFIIWNRFTLAYRQHGNVWLAIKQCL